MKTYAFILGREAKLSLAELVQLLRSQERKFNLLAFSGQVVLIKTDFIDSEFFHRLGGSIKFGEVKAVQPDHVPSKLDKQVRERLDDDKFYLGASIYSATDRVTKRELERYRQDIRKQLFNIKACLKQEDQTLRIVESKEAQLSSVVVTKNHLTTHRGMEFLVIYGENKLWLGVTEAVQDFEAFAKRDHARPFRDDRSGMLPPKLARMMINLSGQHIDEDTVLLDPFCGSGTVLQEAILLGAGKVLGSDLSEQAVMDTVGNLSWLIQQQMIRSEYSVEQVDVEELHTWIPANFVDLIVTEPYLGAPVKGKIPKSDIKERQDSLAELYDKALIQYHHVLKPGGMAVMIFPFIQNSRLPLPRHLCRLFEQVNIGDEVVSSNRLGIDYQRPGQTVGREIMVLRKPDDRSIIREV